MEKSIFTPEYALLCKELASVRKKAGLTQRVLAERLHVPHSWVAKVESGERRIDFLEIYWFLTGCEHEPMAFFKQTVRRLTARKRRSTEA